MTGIIACKVCGQVHELDGEPPRGMVARCRRCGSKIARRTHRSLHLTAALSLAALIMYVPANVFPIMRMEMYGATMDNTVWQGSVRLFDDGQWGVAIVVFLASILIPLLKLMGLFFLSGTAMFHMQRWRGLRTGVYRFIDGIGRWAMLDVFVLAILVSLVKLQQLATIVPGPGVLAFCAVVVLTLLASASFEPQLIWEEQEVDE
jgi:paraquat-inducible protein A